MTKLISGLFNEWYIGANVSSLILSKRLSCMAWMSIQFTRLTMLRMWWLRGSF